MDAKRKVLRDTNSSMNDSTSAVSRTLDQLYEKKSALTYAMWNDEPPGSHPFGPPYAHEKGVIAFDGKMGFLLIHSVPKFPMVLRGQSSSRKSYREGIASKPTYAQSFLCISIGKDSLSTIDKLLNIQKLNIYDSADNAHVGVPGLRGQVEGVAMTMSVQSFGGKTFEVFSKSNTYGQDIFSALLAPHFRTHFIAQTWQGGGGDMPNCCLRYMVMTARTIEIDGQRWKSGSDHSKWAVSEDGAIFCLGGVNRQDGQLKRGGGLYCIKDFQIGKQMRQAISSYEECESYGRFWLCLGLVFLVITCGVACLWYVYRDQVVASDHLFGRVYNSVYACAVH